MIFIMPQTPHLEKHFTAGDAVRDVVIGMSDGLTVPFALAAGLTGAIASSHIILTAGFAEIAAGSIAMGLGGYLAARSDAEHYASERLREEQEIVTVPDVEAQEVREIFQSYGLTDAESASVVDALRQRPQDWVDFMMRFELGLEKCADHRAGVHRGRRDSVGCLSVLRRCASGVVGVRGRDAGGAGGFRRHQRPVHRHPRAAQRPANDLDRRAGGGGGLSHCALDFVAVQPCFLMFFCRFSVLIMP